MPLPTKRSHQHLLIFFSQFLPLVATFLNLWMQKTSTLTILGPVWYLRTPSPRPSALRFSSIYLAGSHILWGQGWSRSIATVLKCLRSYQLWHVSHSHSALPSQCTHLLDTKEELWWVLVLGGQSPNLLTSKGSGSLAAVLTAGLIFLLTPGQCRKAREERRTLIQKMLTIMVIPTHWSFTYQNGLWFYPPSCLGGT